MVRRTCYEQVGPFDEKQLRSQDYEMLLRLAHRCDGVVLTEPTFIRRTHTGERGPAKDRHRQTEQRKKWVEYDQLFMRRYYTELPLATYVGSSCNDDELSPEDRTSALLRRTAIVARKGMPDLMVLDIREAAATPGNRLTTEQIALGCKVFAATNPAALQKLLKHPDLASQVRDACRTRKGLAIRLALAKGAYHQCRREIRDRCFPEVMQLALLVPRLLGVAGLGHALQKTCRRQPDRNGH
ncbi:MAG: hypothetical protein V2J89_01620, partial [Halieaceae bacterium]|jgi:hypothetical protein|nr:hypothetical protein [Halieaceae bacterium]